MIERAIKLRSCINDFCLDHAESLHGKAGAKASANPTTEEQEHMLKNDTLTGDDWIALTEVMRILEKFYVLTKRGEGTKLQGDRGILSDYMTTLNSLLLHMKEIKDDFDTRAKSQSTSTPSVVYINQCIINCWTKLDEYFAKVDETPALYASIVTQPHMKWKYFQRKWKDVHTWKHAVRPRQWLPNGKSALETLWWDEYKFIEIPKGLSGVGTKRACSPDDFEKENDMT
jgi:hypothetical protein